MGSNQECPDPPFFQILEGGGTSLRLPPNQGCADFRPFFLNRGKWNNPQESFIKKTRILSCPLLEDIKPLIL